MARYLSLLLISITIAQGLKINDVSENGPKKVSPSSLLQTSDALAAIKDAGAALLSGDHGMAKKAGKTAMLATVSTIMKGAAKVGGLTLSEDDMNAAIHKAQNSKELHGVLDNFFKDISLEDLTSFPQSVSLLQQNMSEDPHKALGSFATEKKKKHDEMRKKKQEELKAQKKEKHDNFAKAQKEQHEKNKAEKAKKHEELKRAKEEHRTKQN